MKGVVKYARGDGYVELREVEDLPPAPNQVKIEVKASGICGSDLHIYHDDINNPIRPPVVIGHEFSGIVVEKGSEAGDEIKVGDRVTGEPSAYICGRCRYCLSEHYYLCPERKLLGTGSTGALPGTATPHLSISFRTTSLSRQGRLRNCSHVASMASPNRRGCRPGTLSS